MNRAEEYKKLARQCDRGIITTAEYKQGLERIGATECRHNIPVATCGRCCNVCLEDFDDCECFNDSGEFQDEEGLKP